MPAPDDVGAFVIFPPVEDDVSIKAMKRLTPRRVLPTVALLAAACIRPDPAAPTPCTEDTPAVPPPAAYAAPAGANAMRTIDDVSADLSRRLPGGYAGLYRDGDRIVLLLADTTKLPATLAALRPALDSIYRSHAYSTFTLEGARVRKVRWSFAQLHDWARHVDPVAWAGGDVDGSDIDEQANRLAYYAADAAAQGRVAVRLAGLGIPCGLAEVRIREPFQVR